MSAEPLVWYKLRWPREVSADQVDSALRALAGAGGSPVVLEAVSEAAEITHRVAVPAGRAGTIAAQLRATLPGLSCEVEETRPAREVTRSVELRTSTRLRPLRTDEPGAISRALITALAQVGRGELLGLQWVLARPAVPVAVPNRLAMPRHESWFGALLTAPFEGTRPADPETLAALRAKQAEPGWRAIGRVAVRAASSSRERQLIRQVLGALRTAEAPSVGFRARSGNPHRFVKAASGWLTPLRLNVSELTALAGWPLGITSELPVSALPFRPLAPTAAIPRSGRVVGNASYPGRERPVALSPDDSRRHLHLIGPTGAGKSTLMLNLIVGDMRAGRAVVVIEPKGDLIADVLARVPANRIDDVVLIDPSDLEKPVGLNPLARAGRSAELVADQLLGMFHALYEANWGPRTQDILGASLLTLARMPGMSLPALPALLTDAAFRRRVLPKVVDPIGLAPFWSSFEAWSEQERNAAIAPVLNKLRPLLLRPEIRNVIGQASPRFDLRQVFTQRKILLVDLASGQLGPETAGLLGSLLVTQLWQAILGRSAVSPERRHPVFVFCDEFQTFLHLPVDFADALAQARGLGVGFVLAHQYLHQLHPSVRASVLANAQSRIAFRLAGEDARALATDGGLAAEDLQGLGAFECYAQLVARGTVQPWFSARTLPPAQAETSAQAVRSASRNAYGIPREQIERELEELILPKAHIHGADDLKPARRNDGGRS